MEFSIQNPHSEKNREEAIPMKKEKFKIIREYKNEYSIREMVDLLIRTHTQPS